MEITNRELMFRILKSKLFLHKDVKKMTIERCTEELTIDFDVMGISYHVRFIDDELIVLHYSLDDALRMSLECNSNSINIIIGLIGIEIFVTT